MWCGYTEKWECSQGIQNMSKGKNAPQLGIFSKHPAVEPCYILYLDLVRDCCLSDLYHNHDVFTTEFTYVKGSFWFFSVHVCKILQRLSAVECFILLMKHPHSFATVIPPNHFVHHEISQPHWNKPRSKQRAISATVKSQQIQCKHSYYGVRLSQQNTQKQNTIDDLTFANKGAEVSYLAVWNRHVRKDAWSFFQINLML